MERLGDEDRIPDVPLGDQAVELAPVAPGGLVEVVRGQQDRPPGQGVGVAQGAERLDGGRDAGLHVRGPAAEESLPLLARRDEREVDGVEVAVELQDAPGPAAPEPDRHGGGRGVSPFGAFDLEPVLGQDLREPVGDRPRLARPARDLDQPDGRLDEPPPIDERSETIAGVFQSVHGASIPVPETPRFTVNRAGFPSDRLSRRHPSADHGPPADRAGTSDRENSSLKFT